MTTPKRWRPLAAAAFASLVLAGSWAQEAAVLSETRQGGIGFAMYQELGGHWRDSTGKSTADGLTPNIGSRCADIGTSGDEGARARWTLTPPADGVYEVQVTWSTSGNARGVTYRITADGQTGETQIDQDGYGFLGDRNSNRWVSLGSFSGGPSSPIQVEVSDQGVTAAPDPSSPGRVYADAVRLAASSGPAAGPIASTASSAPAAPAPAQAPPPPATEEPADAFAPAETAPPAPPAEVAEPAETTEIADVFAPAETTEPAPTEDISSGFSEPLPPVPESTPVAEPTPVAQTTAADSIDWSTDFQTASQLAETSGQDLLVNFVTSRSRDARRMEADTWTNPAVVSAVTGRFIPVRVEMEDNQSLCSQIGIYRSPTTAIVRMDNGTPQVITRIVGYVGAQEMRRQISSAGGTTP